MKAAVAAVLLGLLCGYAHAQATERMGIWIPMYASTAGSPEYTKLIQSVEGDKCLANSFHGTVLTGPRSGPPSPADAAEDKQFRDAFALVASTNQWTAFGYVTTRYMKRPLDEVLRDIDTWLTAGAAGYGDMVQGVWVDNVVADFDAEAKAYYGAVAARIKGYGKLVALNPGTTLRDCAFLEEAGVAFVNNLENTWDFWQKVGVKASDGRFDCPCRKATRCIASIHGRAGKATARDVAETLNVLAARGYDAAFMTDRVMPDHYSALPTIWPEVVTAACTVVLTPGSGKATAPRRLLAA